jgi:hypothetical protein
MERHQVLPKSGIRSFLTRLDTILESHGQTHQDIYYPNTQTVICCSCYSIKVYPMGEIAMARSFVLL